MSDFDAPTFGDEREQVGANNPPGAIEQAGAAFGALSAWLLANPAILDEETARSGKLQLDRATATQKDVEDDRAKKADPVYARWKAIREPYTAPLEKLGKLIAELRKRMTAFAVAEEARRKTIAAEVARKAEEARLAALTAEEAEREAIDNASVGDLEANVGQAVAKADEAFKESQRAQRAADIAERDSHVRIGGGFAKASGLRTNWIYEVTHPSEAFAALWPNEDLHEALKKAARAYEKRTGSIPPGVVKKEDRRI